MIKNLMFDLGGVIMDIKKDNCVDALTALGFPNPSDYLGDFSQKGPFGQLEQGLITPDEFRAFIRSKIAHQVTDGEIDTAFDKFLIGIPVSRLQQLQELRDRYGIYLLSNTNKIMWDGKIAEEFRKDGLNVEGYFDGITTSFEAKALKPSAEIFDYAGRTMHILPEDTLFLDDSLANVKAAESLGWHGAHVPEGKEFFKILKDLNLV